MEIENSLDELLNEASKINSSEEVENNFGRQTFNPLWGKLNIIDDETYTIIYNPFEKMRVDKKLMKMDEFATSVFLMLKNKYKESPKTVKVDLDDAIKKITELNSTCDAKEVLKLIFNDGEEVKFKLYTKNKINYARLMLEKRETLVKNHNK